MKNFYTPNELIKILGLSKNTIYKYLREGSIKTLRIGKGAYRIPVSEVERMLNVVGGDLSVLDDVSGGGKVQLQLPNEQVASSSSQSLAGNERPSNYLRGVWKTLGGLRTDSDGSDLFDWMMGIMSAMIGFSFFFSPSYMYRYEFLPVVGQFQILRFFLVGGGFLLIFSDLFWNRNGDVHRFINLLMAGLYGWLTGLLFIAGSHQAVIFYVAVALVFLFTVVKGELQVVWKYFILLIIFLLILAISLIIAPELYSRADRWLVSREAGYVLLGVITLIIFLWSYGVKRGKTFLTFLVSGSIGVIFLWFAYVMVGMEAWDRVVAYIVLGVFSFLLPYWKSYKVSWQENRSQVVREAVIVTAVVVLSVGLFGYINRAIRMDFSERELQQRSDDISLYVENWVMASKKDIKTLSESSLLREAMVQGDDKLLYGVIRDFARSSDTLLQVIVLDDGGYVADYYPRTSPELRGSNFAFREYFRRASSGDVFMGNLFQASIEGSPWIIPVSAPIYDAQGMIMGIIGGRMNLFMLQDYLNEIEIGDGGRVLLVDAVGRAIVHPNDSKLYQLVGEEYIKLTTVNGGSIMEEYGYVGGGDRKEFLVGYVSAASSHGWVLSINRPISDVVGRVSGLTFLVFLTSLTISLILLVGYRFRMN